VIVVDDLSHGRRENLPAGAQLLTPDIRERQGLAADARLVSGRLRRQRQARTVAFTRCEPG